MNKLTLPNLDITSLSAAYKAENEYQWLTVEVTRMKGSASTSLYTKIKVWVTGTHRSTTMEILLMWSVTTTIQLTTAKPILPLKTKLEKEFDEKSCTLLEDLLHLFYWISWVILYDHFTKFTEAKFYDIQYLRYWIGSKMS